MLLVPVRAILSLSRINAKHQLTQKRTHACSLHIGEPADYPIDHPTRGIRQAIKRARLLMGPRKRETRILPPRPGNCPATTLPPRHHTTIYSPQIQRNVLPVVTKTFVVPNSRVSARVVDVRGSWLSHSFH